MSGTRPRRTTAVAEPADAGFTLVEVMVTVAVLVTLLGIAVGGWTAYGRSREADGTAKEIQAMLRQAQQRAVSEGRTVCVLFDPATDGWTAYRGACDSPTKTAISGASGEAQGSVDLVSPQFTSGPSGTSAGVTFLPRGTAWPGELTVARPGTDGRTISVEGLTGRVSIS